jgi:hypothetical protein
MKVRQVGVGVAVLLGAACGGVVIVEGEGGSGGSGASSGTTGKTGPANVASSSDASSGTFATTSTGPVDPCVGLPCGETCYVCNDFECLEGFCDGEGACNPEVVACRTHPLCYVPDPGVPCAPAGEEAEPLLCACSGKGCTFFGVVVQGPFIENGSCCYLVTGDCVPNP